MSSIKFHSNSFLFLIFILLTTFGYSTSIKSIEGNEVYAITSSADQYLEIVDALSNHIMGIITLTDAELEENHELILQNIEVLNSDVEAISQSFDLVQLFEDTYGAIFTTTDTKNGIQRNYSSDGFNLHRNIILIQQGLVDYAFNSELLETNQSLFENKFFQTSTYFPGSVDGPSDPETIEKATIRCSYMLAPGTQPWATIGNENVVRPTGTYLAPGSVAEVSVPQTLVDKGIKIRVGAHFWNLENKNTFKRMDRVSILYNVIETTTKIAHPLGGGIYIEIPLGVDEGELEIELKNVVRSPFFSKKSFHETTLEEWLEIERNHQAPWADFETDKFMMQVPTSWIYAFDNPKSLLEDWDNSMDAVSDLLARPRITDRHKNYLQFDVVIRGGAYHPGYPMSNTPYNPNDPTDGTPKHNILKGPQFQQDIHFHELGHEVAISKFQGETEAIVNFLYIPVLEQYFDHTLDEAFEKSFGPSYGYYANKTEVTKTRLVANSFQEGVPRNICNCTKNEVRYQQRGYAHYVDIVELYGWEALENFFAAEGEAADMGNPFPVNNQDQDDRIFRLSQAAGVDLRPLVHFWGIHPKEPDALEQLMLDNNLYPPMDIKAKLHAYRDLIPSNNEEFVAFANELYPDFQNYDGNQFDYGEGWYQKQAETYDETTAQTIEDELSYIIKLYYGTDCFELDMFIQPEFTIDTQYCKNNMSIPLPTISDNGVEGNWFPSEISTAIAGNTQYSFSPALESCAESFDLSVHVDQFEMDISGFNMICHNTTEIISVNADFKTYSWLLDGEEISNENVAFLNNGGFLELFVTDEEDCEGYGSTLVEETDSIGVIIEVIGPLCYGEIGEVVVESIYGPDVEYSYVILGDLENDEEFELIATDMYGCSKSFFFTIEKPEEIIISIENSEIVVTGGTAPYEITVDTIGNIQQVMVIDDNGCVKNAEFTITSTIEFDNNFIIYPNPASERLFIESISGKGPNIDRVNLYSIDGQMIREYTQNTSILDISGISKGVYLCEIHLQKGKSITKRFIVL